MLAAWLSVAALSACASPQRQSHTGPETPNRYGGTATRTFLIPYYDVRSAVVGMFHYTAIRLDLLEPIAGGEYARGARADLQVQVTFVRSDETSTEVRVDAWRAAIFGDTGAAQAILGMLEHRLGLGSGASR